MSRYSLQMECLENIEAFSDEQMSREMAVIESVLEIYDKAILMMELSNKDIDIPDCSMFMESTFFQEENETQPAEQQQQQNSNPAQAGNEGEAAKTGNNGNNNSGKNEKGEKVTDNPEEYNKEHHFRKANKEGKLENMFISILLFIPRLIALPIKLLVNFIKKKKNDKAADDVKKATPEEKAKVAEELKKNEGATNNNTTIKNGEITASATMNGDNGDEQIWIGLDGDANIFTNIDMDAVSRGLDNTYGAIVQTLNNPDNLKSTKPISFNFETVKQQTENANKQHAEKRVKEQLEAFEDKRAQILTSLSKRLSELENCRSTIEDSIKQLERPGALKGYNLAQVVNARKEDLNSIKMVVKWTSNCVKALQAVDTLTEEVLSTYSNYLTQIRNITNKAQNAATEDVSALNQNNMDLASGNRPSHEFHNDPVLPRKENNNGQQNNPAGSR